MLFWGLRPTRKKIIFIYCCSLQWHLKRFLLLWQVLKWQKISIWKWETFLPFDIWYGYKPAMFIYRISSYKALPRLTFDKLFENPNPHFITRLSGVRIWSQLWIMYTYLHKWMQEFSFYIITSILPIFEPTFLISELKGKGHEPSRAKLKILQLELWLEPARLGLITSNCRIRISDNIGSGS